MEAQFIWHIRTLETYLFFLSKQNTFYFGNIDLPIYINIITGVLFLNKFIKNGNYSLKNN